MIKWPKRRPKTVHKSVRDELSESQKETLRRRLRFVELELEVLRREYR